MCLQDSILTNAEQKLCALSFSNLIFVYGEKFSRGMMKLKSGLRRYRSARGAHFRSLKKRELGP